MTPPCAEPRCPFKSGMRQRVACRRCHAHRDLTVAPCCQVCGAESFDPVGPTTTDLHAINAEIIAAAEDVDAHLDRTHLKIVPGLARLREACRARALAHAGWTP